MSEIDDKLKKSKKRKALRNRILGFVELGIIIFLMCYLIFIVFINKIIGFYCITENGNLTNCTDETEKVIVDSKEKCQEFCDLQGYENATYRSSLFNKECECYNETKCLNAFVIGYNGSLPPC